MTPCPYCDKELKEAATFCPYCGKTFGLPGTPDAVPAAGPQASERPRPFKRFWARHFDYCLLGIPLAAACYLYYPEVLQLPLGGFGVLVMFLWVVLESCLLATWGTTPGKWFCGITVRDVRSRRLTVRAALTRSLSVWVRGMCLGLPLVGVVTQALAYKRLMSDGKAPWDAGKDFGVVHHPAGLVRRLVFVFLFAAYYASLAFFLFQRHRSY